MARFFFDFCHAGQREADGTGVDLTTVEQAYLEAFKAVQELWSELLKQRHDPRRCSFEVRSEQGDILFTFPFLEVFDCCIDRSSPQQLSRTFAELSRTHQYARRVHGDLVDEFHLTRAVLRQSQRLLKVPLD